MLILKKIPLLLLSFILASAGRVLGHAADFSRVDSDLAGLDLTISKTQSEFDKIPANPHDKEWVKLKLRHMFETDQLIRMWDIPFKRKYSRAELKYTEEQFIGRFGSTDASNQKDLKDLLKIHHWFTISEFGAEADADAWLIVQHADQDVPFQKEILRRLESLYSNGETKPRNYAYLFDRVATNENRPQRYGTQGHCIRAGTWEPKPLENPGQVNDLRKSVGLESLEKYKKSTSNTCR